MSLTFRSDDIQDLVRRCLNRDQKAWAQLVDRFQNLVYSIPKRYGMNADDAADVFQATFQALLRSLDRIEDAKTLPRWLAVTASRESLRILRISKRLVSADDTGLDLEMIVDEEELRADENAVAAERADTVRRLTHELNERCRELLSRLYFEDEPSYQEISEQLGMPIGAIGPTRARCLEKLRQKLEKEAIFD